MRKKTLIAAVVGALAAGAMVGGATTALAQADVVRNGGVPCAKVGREERPNPRLEPVE